MKNRLFSFNRLFSLFALFCLIAGIRPGGSPRAAHALEPLSFTDALGHTVTLQSHDRVAALYGSFAETWLLAGGTLIGVTSDALEERALSLPEDVAIVGSVKEPHLEEIIAADPDFLILSADIAAQVKLHGALKNAGIPHAYYRADTFEEYLGMLRQFTQMTRRDDLYARYGEDVRAQIERVRQAVRGQEPPTALLLRAFSTGVKAKGEDNLAGVILRELGAVNIAAQGNGLLEEISLEEIIAADPDFIFITVMGARVDDALTYMQTHFESNPAWASLSAVRSGRCVVLPKELFHYKPNARWGESYAYLAKILYPGCCDEID